MLTGIRECGGDIMEGEEGCGGWKAPHEISKAEDVTPLLELLCPGLG